MTAIPRHPVLGVEVAAVDLDAALRIIETWIALGERHYVCLGGAHLLIEARDDPALRRIYNRAGMMTCDGMPLVWLCRLAGHSNVSRVYGPELMLAAARDPTLSRKRHFFYGGDEGVAGLLAETLVKRFPGLTIAGSYCPPFRPLTDDEETAVATMLNESHAEIIWVGLGSPKQDRWMAAFRDRLEAPVLIGVGAAFDFLTGRKSQAPYWIQRSGFEWLFRTMTEPKRLIRRYGRVVPRFIGLALAEKMGFMRFPVER
jgi:N-acetylglucosaminyldiphosphoundecaprenol N-acetyl-beta-D-mannosaminyltransferase